MFYRKPFVFLLLSIVLLLAALLPQSLNAAPTIQTKLPTATATSAPTKPKPTATLTPKATSTVKVTPTSVATSTSGITSTVENTESEVISTTQSTPETEVVASASTVTTTVDTNNGPPFDWASSENYLILGTDRRAGTTDWRTDTIILVGFDRANQRAAVFSIPRDLYVNIPGYGMGRINQVDFMGERRNGEGGGPALISQVLSEALGVSTVHWLRVQMDGFVSFVDAVGGVTVTLDCPFSEPIFNLTTQSWDEFTLPAGDNLLDGDSAYWFVRLRLRESDIGRANRQRQFLWALRNKVLSTNLITRAPELWSAFSGTFSTDLNLFQMLELGSFSLQLQPENVRASGLTLVDLQNFITTGGQQVLRIGNPAHVRSKLANVWAAPAMVDSNRRNASTCQPLPDFSAQNLPAVSAGSTNETGSTGGQNGSTAPTSVPVESLPASKNADPTLAIGSRVRIRKGFTLTVRSRPDENAGKIFGNMADGKQAVILDGPAKSAGQGDTIVWWYVRTDDGVEGWAPANTSETWLLQVVK